MTKSRHPLPNGTRVRHGGEKYAKAYRLGTAFVRGHEVRSGGHIEYIIERDKPLTTGGDRMTEWASYYTHPVEVGPA